MSTFQRNTLSPYSGHCFCAGRSGKTGQQVATRQRKEKCPLHSTCVVQSIIERAVRSTVKRHRKWIKRNKDSRKQTKKWERETKKRKGKSRNEKEREEHKEKQRKRNGVQMSCLPRLLSFFSSMLWFNTWPDHLSTPENSSLCYKSGEVQIARPPAVWSKHSPQFRILECYVTMVTTAFFQIHYDSLYTTILMF